MILLIFSLIVRTEIQVIFKYFDDTVRVNKNKVFWGLLLIFEFDSGLFHRAILMSGSGAAPWSMVEDPGMNKCQTEF